MTSDPAPGTDVPADTRSAHFAAYVEPARRRPQIWRLLVGLAIVGVLMLAWQLLVFGIAAARIYLQTRGDVQAVNDFLQSVMGLQTPLGIFLALASFGGVWFGVWLAVRVMHKRGLRTLFAAPGQPLLAGAGRGAAVALGLAAIPFLVTLPFAEPPVRSELALSDWLALVLILIPLVCIQTSAEELVFRGYMLQQLAARFRHPLIWGALPAFLFGAMHWWNVDEGPLASMLYVVAASSIGFAAAIMVHRTGGLGAALGFHAVYNVIAFSFFGAEGAYDGLSLYVVPKSDITVSLAIDASVLVMFTVFLVSPWSPFRPRARPAGAPRDAPLD